MKKIILTSIFIMFAVLLPMMGFGADGNINIFVDNNPVCGASIPCGESITLDVYAVLEGASSAGITGAEYSVAIGPVNISSAGTTEDLAVDDLLITEDFTPITSLGGIVVGPGAFTPGDPSDRGVSVAFTSCQTGDGTKVLLETIVVTNVGCLPGGTPTEVPIRIIRHDSPLNVFFQCPLFTLCDSPAFTKVCLGDDLITCQVPLPPFPLTATCSSSGEFLINPAPGSFCVISDIQQVEVDIKPGTDPNSINLKSKGVITVAILTTEDFDATTIDPLSVEFGPDGAEAAHGDGHNIVDADDDGDLDLVLHFLTQETGIECGDTEAGLTGETFDGQAIEGFDSINIVKCN